MKVSVVMAGKNSDPVFLKEAIYSILNQTFQDFEFIFVDDGSEKPLEPVVREISKDERITVYRIPSSGLGAALNYGVSKSNGELIARIDDDDISLPTRFEKQVKYMDEHPEVSCLGTQIHFKCGNKIYPHGRFPVKHEDIIGCIAKLHFVFGHTVLMFRRSCFDKIGGYRIPGGGQDLDLFLQMGTVGKINNLDEYLGFYTMSIKGLSVTNPQKKEAYIFALESALKYDGYSPYYNDIEKSIEKLKKGEGFLYHKIERAKRRLLIWLTMYFGKSVESVKYE